MPAGGKIAADGRQAQAPGVGAQARRHDLEQPKTPGLHDSDLQQGDVSRLEQAQKVAPIRGKQVQRAAGPQSARQRQGAKRGSGDFAMEAPDPIQMAASRMGGSASPVQGGGGELDPTPWMPYLRMLANSPGSGGGLSAAMVDLLAQAQRKPTTSNPRLLDLDELDRAFG